MYILYLCTVQAAIVAINTALDEGDADSMLKTLQNEHLDLSDVSPDNKEYYFNGLRAKKQEKTEVRVCLHIHTFIHV